MLPLTEEENEWQKNQKSYHICKNKFHNVNDSNKDSGDDLIVTNTRSSRPEVFC